MFEELNWLWNSANTFMFVGPVGLGKAAFSGSSRYFLKKPALMAAIIADGVAESKCLICMMYCEAAACM